MIALFPRYSVANLFDYHASDFGSAIWVAEHRKTIMESPFRRAKLEPKNPSTSPITIEWEVLDAGGFRQMLVPSLEKKQSSRRLLQTLGMVFSPPKSVSVSALAGPEIDSGLIRIHEAAVDFTLQNMGPLLVGRQGDKLVSQSCHVLKFLHPFSRTDDPQLHTHVELLPVFDDQFHALHTYPLFYHQYALRCFYHFCLVAGLIKSGYGVRVDDPHSLRWELDGVVPDVCRIFSARAEMVAEGTDFVLHKAAIRFAALQSLRHFPKPQPEFSLSKARRVWSAAVLPKQCLPRRVDPRKYADLILGDLSTAFVASSVATDFALQGRILAACLGQCAYPQDAIKVICNRAKDAVLRGELIMSPKKVYCDPKSFDVEKRIIDLVHSGLGNGSKCRVAGFAHGHQPRIVASAAGRLDRIRIIPTSSAIPDWCNLEPNGTTRSSTSKPVFRTIPTWDSVAALTILEAHPDTDIMLLVKGPVHCGDFAAFISKLASGPDPESLARLKALKPWPRQPKTTVEVRQGVLPSSPEAELPEIERRILTERAHALAHDGYSEQVRRAVNMAIANRLLQSSLNQKAGPNITLDEVLPWDWLERGEVPWAGTNLVCYSNNEIMQTGQRWLVLGQGQGDTLLLKGARKTSSVSLGDIEARRDKISVVRRYDLRLVPGLALESMQRLRAPGCSIRRGEIVYVECLDTSGRIRLVSKSGPVPPRFRAFMPATIVKSMDGFQSPPDFVAVVESHNLRIFEALEPCRRVPRIWLLSDNPSATKLRFAKELLTRVAGAKARSIAAELTGGDLIIPGRSYWSQQIKLRSLADPAVTLPATRDAPLYAQPRRESTDDEKEAAPSKLVNEVPVVPPFRKPLLLVKKKKRRPTEPEMPGL